MVKKIMAFVFSTVMVFGSLATSTAVDSYTALSKNTDEVEGVLYKDGYVSVDVECSPTSISAAAACKRALENTDDNFDSIISRYITESIVLLVMVGCLLLFIQVKSKTEPCSMLIEQ